MNNSIKILSVTQVNRYIKAKIEEDENLSLVYVKGEISNFTNHYKTGHLYFTIKDEDSVLKAVMFRSHASCLKFRPEDGLKVIVSGSISVYEKSGQYQLYCTDMQPDGVGALHLAYEQLKTQLSQEGLFSEYHKKPLPILPSKIAVVTSDTGAAIQDILRILERRYPLGKVIIAPVLVQGENAPKQIADAIKYVDDHNLADVIITGRGGGSIEELWSFNTEIVARAIYNCNTPIISAVGHETDFTISDFVADVRASTPSAAAEIVAPDISSLKNGLQNTQTRLINQMNYKVNHYNSKLESFKTNKALANSLYNVDIKSKMLENMKASMIKTMQSKLDVKFSELKNHSGMLNALSPLNILSRGYSITFKDNHIINDKEDINSGDHITVKLKNASLNCEVLEIIDD